MTTLEVRGLSFPTRHPLRYPLFSFVPPSNVRFSSTSLYDFETIPVKFKFNSFSFRNDLNTIQSIFQSFKNFIFIQRQKNRPILSSTIWINFSSSIEGKKKAKKTKREREKKISFNFNLWRRSVVQRRRVNKIEGAVWKNERKKKEEKKSKREYDEEWRWRRHLSCFIGLHLVCGYGRIIACRGWDSRLDQKGVLGLLAACMFNELTATTAAECFLKSSSSANEPNLT